ncbi:hypothetical protein B4110_3411 [Parageobacillus toebii]|uniref:Uncharacterized protein n=1 Tax=Parageobacillus toebii TaxID=153151 RepID=A0A150MZG5_9BACL|nr:hypothetical protein B4110_3411 [Parageobacillus toebii]
MEMMPSFFIKNKIVSKKVNISLYTSLVKRKLINVTNY